jgi:hypothetical protein
MLNIGLRVSETSTVSGAENRDDTRIAKNLKVAEQIEEVGKVSLLLVQCGKLYREIYSETLPVATVRKFITDSLHTE